MGEMYYTINQLCSMFGKSTKTLYRVHTDYKLGSIQYIAEGRRLLFTEPDVIKMRKIFSVNSKENLLKQQIVQEIIKALEYKPMNLYDLTKSLDRGIKGSIQNTLVAMTNVFEELSEDSKGVLYWGNQSDSVSNDGCPVRNVYHSNKTGKVVFCNTYSGVLDDNDSNYRLIRIDKCLYQRDSTGKMSFENDIVEIRGEDVTAYSDMPVGFKIVGTKQD